MKRTSRPLPPDRPPSLAASARVAGWGTVAWAGVALAGAFFEKTATVTLVVQAVIAEWGAGRAGVAWTEFGGRASAGGSRVGSMARGAAMGGALAAAVVSLALALHAATPWPTTASGGAILIGLASSALAAFRDELLLRGVVLRATRGLLPAWSQVLASGATAVAAAWGARGSSDAGLLLAEGMRGAALGGVWLRGGGWMAIAASAAWRWSFGSLTRGALWDLRFDAAPEATPASLALLSAAALAALWAVRRTGTTQPDPA